MDPVIYFNQPPVDHAAVFNQPSTNLALPPPSVEQVELAKLDPKKPDLGLSPALIQVLKQANQCLHASRITPEEAATILVYWLEYFYKNSLAKENPSLFLIKKEMISYFCECSHEKNYKIANWFLTNAHFIQEYTQKAFKDPKKQVELLQLIFEKIKDLSLKYGIKEHLDVLLKNVFDFLKDDSRSFNEKTALEVLGKLEKLSSSLYEDRYCLFAKFRDTQPQNFLNLTKILFYYLENQVDPIPSFIESLLFLLEKVSCRSGSDLEKLLPTVLKALESKQERFSEGTFAKAYARVYGRFLRLYFEESGAYDLNQDTDKKRLLYLVFLTPADFDSSTQGFSLSEMTKILDFESAQALSSADEQGKALGVFLNQFFNFVQSLKEPLAQKEIKIDSVFKAYFKNPNNFGYTQFGLIFSELFNQLDNYFKDLEKQKTPSDLFEHTFILIKAFANTLEKGIYKNVLRCQNESICSCSDLILSIINKKLLGFANCPALDASRKVSILADLVVLLKENKESLALSFPLEWLIEDMTPKQIGNVLSVYVSEPKDYKPHEHEVAFELLQNIHPYLDRERSTALIENLEAKKDFFELSPYKEKYRVLYQDALISYFFHKMTHSQVYFLDYKKDARRLGKVSIALYEAFIKRVLTQENLMYVDNPLNGEDLEAAHPPLLKDLKCKVILNQDGYFEVDSSFIEKLSLEPSMGSPLYLSDADKTLIGYTAYIPENPRAVLVEVYGGREKKEKKEAPQSSLPKLLDRGLLDQKIAVIKLNLPDLLELSVHQSQMPSDLYKKIQACIHTFYTALSAFPGSLHKELDTLKGLPLSLYGASFGGSLSFNQSRLYPNSFSRYISHSGVLDPSQNFYDEKLKTKDPTINQRFSVAEQRSDLKDTYLVLHTANDSRVNVHCSLGFYQKADAENQSVKLNIFPKGGRAVIEGFSKFTYTGHGAPVLKKSFNLYTQEIVNFLTKDNPISLLSRAISRWRAHTYEAYMDKYTYNRVNFQNEPLGSIEKRVLSQLYLRYKNACLWKGKDADLAGPSGILDKTKADAVWDTYYFPQYKAYRVAECLLEDLGGDKKMIKKFLMGKNLNMPLEKAAERFLEEHLPYFEEILNMNISRNALDIHSLSRNIGLLFKESLNLAVYGQAVEATDCSYYDFSKKHLDFLATLFVECPDYIKNVLEDEKIKRIEEESPKLKELFLNLIRQSRQLGERVITQGILSLHKEQRLEPLLNAYRKSKKASP